MSLADSQTWALKVHNALRQRDCLIHYIFSAFPMSLRCWANLIPCWHSVWEGLGAERVKEKMWREDDGSFIKIEVGERKEEGIGQGDRKGLEDQRSKNQNHSWNDTLLIRVPYFSPAMAPTHSLQMRQLATNGNLWSFNSAQTAGALCSCHHWSV